MPILYMFKELKNVFEFSMCLDNVPKTYRIAFTKLRLSSHPLRIETGLYGNERTNQNQRYCLICGSGDIEDEYHFVCIFKPYETIRKNILRKSTMLDQVLQNISISYKRLIQVFFYGYVNLFMKLLLYVQIYCDNYNEYKSLLLYYMPVQPQVDFDII